MCKCFRQGNGDSFGQHGRERNCMRMGVGSLQCYRAHNYNATTNTLPFDSCHFLSVIFASSLRDILKKKTFHTFGKSGTIVRFHFHLFLGFFFSTLLYFIYNTSVSVLRAAIFRFRICFFRQLNGLCWTHF